MPTKGRLETHVDDLSNHSSSTNDYVPAIKHYREMRRNLPKEWFWQLTLKVYCSFVAPGACSAKSLVVEEIALLLTMAFGSSFCQQSHSLISLIWSGTGSYLPLWPHIMGFLSNIQDQIEVTRLKNS